MGCNITLRGIAYDCTPNLAGVKELWLSDYNDVLGVTVTADPSTGVESISDIDMSTGILFKKYDFAKNSASLTKTLTKDETSGYKFYTNEVVANFNHMDAEKRREMNQIDGGRLAAIVVDMNDEKWFLGRDNYATCTAASGQTGAAPEDGNFYSLTVTDTSRSLPLTVDASAFAAVTGA